ncbi:uncharacterized protein MYCFIDRAFT_43202 [Pseudocercospora fijiensis CIRAD86]|uniref:NmrA-like domain-containing protein n=1 Tax=Pseudocercospora fijiensis (strain CIRAD86) TaxID=383855 RepID=M3AYF6_PSEFD|nr:uncharacterized protein MYCFIDRAFT_43202 [Pseudocercospora fijiensis CIRAD86]EME82203.1 hypothetical protein MYCFIDRAFT_43202 [Pseudocercospora fijiensis CIRAD86]
MTILITGSNGKTASHLSRMLHSSTSDQANKQIYPILVASRRPKDDSPYPTVRFDWTDQLTFELPFAHAQAKASPITAAYLVGLDVMNVSQLVLRFVDFARRRGVKRFVLVSAWEISAGGPLNGRTHEELKILGQRNEIEWTVLRPHFFMENFIESYSLKTIREEGKIYSAAEDGRLPFISARDIAATGYRALIDEQPHNTDHIITGGESLSYDEVAEILSEVLGKVIEHVKLSHSDFRQLLAANGVSKEMAEYLADLDVAVANGHGAEPTNVVQRVTGNMPRTFRDFAMDNKSLWL